jgi:hypothetical protein
MTTWLYILILLAGLWLVYRIRKIIAHKKFIGRRVTVSYCDQNYHFESIFPADGTVTKSIKIKTTTFFVVKMDNPFVYEKTNYDTIIIRERSTRHLGLDNYVAVHVLLPKVNLDKTDYSFDEFDHVVWADIDLI